MLAFLLKLLEIVGGLLMNRQPVPAPQPTLSDIQEATANVQKAASDAGDAAARSIDTDVKLRVVEAADPNNRDNG